LSAVKRFLISYTDSKGISVKHGQQKPIPFMKLSGSGNDFILIDNRKSEYSGVTREQVSKICDRRFGIGADGQLRGELLAWDSTDLF